MSKRKWAAVAILAAYLSECEKDDKKKREKEKVVRIRRAWTKNWIQKRTEDNFCSKLLIDLRAEDPAIYENFLRMSATQFDALLHLVRPSIEKQETNMRSSIPAQDRLIITLRYLATGERFTALQHLFSIPQTTISRIIPEVLDAIYNVLVKDFVKLPKTEDEWKYLSQQFNDRWQFPNCIGAVDGRHVAMVALKSGGSSFYNYKGTHSIVLMGIADAEYKLIYVDVGRNGNSDGGIFNSCSFSQALDNEQLCLPSPEALPGRQVPVPHVLVADDAFPLRENVMKPFSQDDSTMVQRVFNYRLSRAHGVIENVFGIMTTRFRVLLNPLHLDARKTKKVVLACCVLHNYLMTTDKRTYAPANAFDQYDAQGTLTSPGEWRSDSEATTRMPSMERPRNCLYSHEAEDVQKEFSNYFVDEGDVEWQYNHI